MNSLFQKLFRNLINKKIFDEFWRSLFKHYKDDAKFDEDKIRYIIRARGRDGRSSNIAVHLNISRRRVEQIHAYYRRFEELHLLKKAGRKAVPIREDEYSIVLDVYDRYKVNVLYLEDRIKKDYGMRINHNHIRKVLKMYGSTS